MYSERIKAFQFKLLPCMKTLMVASFLTHTFLAVYAQNNAEAAKWPVPQNVPGLLFYIQRDPNINTVCYAVKTLADGTLDHNDPVEIFWMNYAADGKKKKLNARQREFGYGLSIIQDGTDSFQMSTIALLNGKMQFLKGKHGRFVVEI